MIIPPVFGKMINSIGGNRCQLRRIIIQPVRSFPAYSRGGGDWAWEYDWKVSTTKRERAENWFFMTNAFKKVTIKSKPEHLTR
jgi:hypothetical protein